MANANTDRLNLPHEEALRAARRGAFWSLPSDAMVDRETVAAVLHVALQTLEMRAIRGGGPVYRRVGKRALYRVGDVRDFMNRAPAVENTAQLVALK
jgi:hypothetical protein